MVLVSLLRSRQFRHLQRRCEARLAHLEIPPTADTAAMCEHLGRQRGRPIYLLPMVLQASAPCGMWLGLPDADFIVYEVHTGKMHQDHIIAHELAHIICGHGSVGTVHESDARALFPDLDPALVREMLQRSRYSNSQEQEAEVMASLVLRRLSRPSVTVSGQINPKDTELTSRLEQALIPSQPTRRVDA